MWRTRTPKEQHLPVNLSGTQDRAGSDVSGKRWEHPPPTGKGPSTAGRRYRISQALEREQATEGEGRTAARGGSWSSELLGSCRDRRWKPYIRRPPCRPERGGTRAHPRRRGCRIPGRPGVEGGPGRHSRRRREWCGRRARRSACPGVRARGSRRTFCTRRPEHRGDHDDRTRVLRHPDAFGSAPEHHRESCVVHRLHPVPAGDQPRASRGSSELSDDGGRSHRYGGREFVNARRGDRSR